MPEERERYICIDLKSFYASVECVARGLDPLRANLLVADDSRTDKTICLAVSPALKAMGVPSRPRLFEAREAIRLYEARTGWKVRYIVAPPRMAEYLRVSAKVYEIYRKFVAEQDIHVYSIDECFIDATPYLHLYAREAQAAGSSPARCMAAHMIREVLRVTGITATVGIGTNLYLAKVGMDIVAKKSPPDENGVRVAELDELSYCLQLWQHRPLTDFWQIGPGKAKRLLRKGIITMGDIAALSLEDEEFFYDQFGVDAEILIDHAWGKESVRMPDIKAYKSADHSLSTGQVLAKPYRYPEGLNVFREMADLLAADLAAKGLTTTGLSWWVDYDPASLDDNLAYAGEVEMDFYGRFKPKPAHGKARLSARTNSGHAIRAALERSFGERVDSTLLIRRLGIAALDVKEDDGVTQLDFFTDAEAAQREQRLQKAVADVRRRFGMNKLIKGMNLLPDATTIQRNGQIGGHRAGETILQQMK